MPEKESSWTPHYDLIRELEKEARLHGKLAGYTIHLDLSDNGGLSDVFVVRKESRKTRARTRGTTIPE